MSQFNFTIGTLASRTNTNVPTIRYYEENGLLPHAQQATNGHRPVKGPRGCWYLQHAV